MVYQSHVRVAWTPSRRRIRPDLRPMVLYVLLLLLIAAGRPAHAVLEAMACTPAIVNMTAVTSDQSDRLAKFYLKYGDIFTGYWIYMADGNSARSSWTDQLPYWANEKRISKHCALMPPCVVTRADKYAYLFYATDDKKTIKCAAYNYDATNGALIAGPDTILSITVTGGFDSFSVSRWPNNSDEVTLVYKTQNVVWMEHLKYHTNAPNSTQWVRTHADPKRLFPIGYDETRGSGCVVANRNAADVDEGYPYKLVYASLSNTQSTSAIMVREIRLDAGGLPDPNAFATAATSPQFLANAQPIANSAKDITLSTMPDGRAILHALSPERSTLDFVGTPNTIDSGKTAWTRDFTYVPFPYVNTPVSLYITHPDEIRPAEGSLVPSLQASTTKIWRHTYGQQYSSHYVGTGYSSAFIGQVGLARRLPTAQVASDNLKQLLIGIVEGPPPVPWQNIATAALSPEYGYVRLSNTQDNSCSVSNDWYVGGVVQVEGASAVGPSIDVKAEAGYSSLATEETHFSKTTTYNFPFVLNGPDPSTGPPYSEANLRLPRNGWAVFLVAGMEVYDYEVLNNNGASIPGAALIHQVVMKEEAISVKHFWLNLSAGHFQPGHLDTYTRTSEDQRYLDDSNNSYLLNAASSPGGGGTGSISSMWDLGALTNSSATLVKNSSNGYGTSFDVSAMLGAGAGGYSVLAGLHATGSWQWTLGLTESYSFETSIESIPISSVFGAYTHFGYNVYWLKEKTDYASQFKTSLADKTGLTQEQSDENDSVLDLIAEDSAPWKITYSLQPSATFSHLGWIRYRRR